MPDNNFHIFCQIVRKICESRDINRKTGVLAAYLKKLKSAEEVRLAAQFLGEGAMPASSGKKKRTAHRTLAMAACRFCEIDYEKVFRPCKAAAGCTIETIEKLMANLDTARAKRASRSVSLGEMQAFFESISAARTRAEKEEQLLQQWKILTPLEIRYSLHLLYPESLQTGLETNDLINSLASAYNQKPERVRRAYELTRDIGKTAELCFNGEPGSADFRMFRPVSFMLATPSNDRLTLDEQHDFVAEDMLEGARCQLHIGGADIRLYSRDLRDITQTFPDVIQTLTSNQPGKAVLDGMLSVFRGDEMLPGSLLRLRLESKQPSRELMQQYPVRFVAFDLIYTEGRSLFEVPLQQRRNLLSEISRTYSIPITRWHRIDRRHTLNHLLDETYARGNDGLILKRTNTGYTPGQRSTDWLKVRKPAGKLNTVLMYVHADSDNPSQPYREFTLGIKVADDGRYEEEFIPIAKVQPDPNKVEVSHLHNEIRELVVERFGTTYALKPGIVMETEFESITPNPRTKAGYTLLRPRLQTIRKDLAPDDCNTLSEVESQYHATHRQKQEAPDRSQALVAVISYQ